MALPAIPPPTIGLPAIWPPSIGLPAIIWLPIIPPAPATPCIPPPSAAFSAAFSSVASSCSATSSPTALPALLPSPSKPAAGGATFVPAAVLPSAFPGRANAPQVKTFTIAMRNCQVPHPLVMSDK